LFYLGSRDHNSEDFHDTTTGKVAQNCRNNITSCCWNVLREKSTIYHKWLHWNFCKKH